MYRSFSGGHKRSSGRDITHARFHSSLRNQHHHLLEMIKITVLASLFIAHRKFFIALPICTVYMEMPTTSSDQFDIVEYKEGTKRGSYK